MGARAIARRWARRGTSTVDALDVGLAAALATLTLVVPTVGRPGTGGRELTEADGMVAVAVFALLLFRRRWPRPVLATSVVLAVVATAWTGRPEPLIMTTAVAAYTVATRTGRTTAWLAGGCAAVIVYTAFAIRMTGDFFGPSLAVTAWIGMATAIGDATRSRRAYIAAVLERARRAEETREEEARRRVADERIRIARDLHDVVAHHIAVISVHAGLADHTLRAHPEQAEASLRHVRQAAQTVLDELSTILSVLRANGDPGAPTDPVRGVSRLGDLLDSLAAAGLRVHHRWLGTARPLPAAVDQAAYRIVQEALTNAHKHGTSGTADLCVGYRDDTIVLHIANSTAGNRPDGAGHGLTGMRERATAVGGHVTAGPDAPGRFHVHAVLPAPPAPGGGS